MILSTRAKVGQEFYFKVISKYWTGSLDWITVIDCDLFILLCTQSDIYVGHCLWLPGSLYLLDSCYNSYPM